MTFTAEQIQQYISKFLQTTQGKAKSPKDFNDFLAQLTEDTKKLDEPSLQGLISALKTYCKNPEDSACFLQAIANGLNLEDKKLTPAILTYIIENFDETTYRTLLRKLLTHELAKTLGGETQLRDKAVSTALMAANFERYKIELETILNDFMLTLPGFTEISEKSYCQDPKPQLNAQGQTLLFSCIQGLLARLSEETTGGALYQISLHSQEIFNTLQALNPQENPENFTKYIAGEVVVRRVANLLLPMSHPETRKDLTSHQKLFINKLFTALNNLSNFISYGNHFEKDTPCGKFYHHLYNGKLPLQGHHDVVSVCQYFHSQHLSQLKIFLLNTMAKSAINIAPETTTAALKSTSESEFVLQNKINALKELLITLTKISTTMQGIPELKKSITYLASFFESMQFAKSNADKCLLMKTIHHSGDFMIPLLAFLEKAASAQSEDSLFTEETDNDHLIRTIICCVLELDLIPWKEFKKYKDAACKGFEEMTDLSRKQPLLEEALSNPKSDGLKGNIWEIYHIAKEGRAPTIGSGNRKLYRALRQLLILSPLYNVPEEEVGRARAASLGVFDVFKRMSTGNGSSPIEIPQTLEEAEEFIAANSKLICALKLDKEGRPVNSELRGLLDTRANLFLSYQKLLSSHEKLLSSQASKPQPCQIKSSTPTTITVEFLKDGERPSLPLKPNHLYLKKTVQQNYSCYYANDGTDMKIKEINTEESNVIDTFSKDLNDPALQGFANGVLLSMAVELDLAGNGTTNYNIKWALKSSPKISGKEEVLPSPPSLGKAEVTTPLTAPTPKPVVASPSLSEDSKPAAKPTTAFPSVKGSEAKPAGSTGRTPRPASTYQGVPLPTLPLALDSLSAATVKPAVSSNSSAPAEPATSSDTPSAPPRARRPASIGKMPPVNPQALAPVVKLTEEPAAVSESAAPSTLSANPHGTFAAPRTGRSNISNGKVVQPFFVEMAAEKPTKDILLNRFYISSQSADTYVYSFKTKEEEQKTGIFTAAEINGMAGRISVTEQFSALSEGEKDSLQRLIKTKYSEQNVTPPAGHAIFIEPKEAPVLRLS